MPPKSISHSFPFNFTLAKPPPSLLYTLQQLPNWFPCFPTLAPSNALTYSPYNGCKTCLKCNSPRISPLMKALQRPPPALKDKSKFLIRLKWVMNLEIMKAFPFRLYKITTRKICRIYNILDKGFLIQGSKLRNLKKYKYLTSWKFKRFYIVKDIINTVFLWKVTEWEKLQKIVIIKDYYP